MKAYRESQWRNYAAPIIAKIIAENPGAAPAALKKVIHAAFPFGPREYHPYKIWLDEVKRQLAGGKCPVFLTAADLNRKPVFGSKSDPFGERRQA